MNKKAERLLRSIEHLGEGAKMVEIGCVRARYEVPTDGFSTFHLATAADEQGFSFTSVDSAPDHVANAVAVTEGLPATIVESDGQAFLATFAGPIDALYLDGAGDPTEALSQFRAARLSDKAVVIIDDVQTFDGNEKGKGDLLLGELERLGFKVTIFGTEPGYLMAVAKR